jgi:hypothetical protein
MSVSGVIRIYSRPLDGRLVPFRLPEVALESLILPGDASFLSVALLLHCNGLNNSTTFIDSSNTARSVTPNGDCKISTTQSKFGGASAVFDGNGDYLSTSISGGLGSGAFTVEFWFYRNSSNPSTSVMFNSRSGNVGTNGIDIFADGRVSTANTWIFENSPVTSIQDNTWTHFALTRDGSAVMRRFFNGTQVGGNSTVTNNFSESTMQIGGSTQLNVGYISGYLDDIRITVGTARYTTNFSPPSEPFPDNLPSSTNSSSSDIYYSLVSLLLHFQGANDSTTFVDSSSYALAASGVVGARINTSQSKFGGSSGLFNNANGNTYITYTPQPSLQMTGDFTIEAWLYPLSSDDMIAASSTSDDNTQIFRLNEGGLPGRLSFYLNGTQVFSPTAANITPNTWQHVAICRAGSSTRMFVNGFQIGGTNTSWTGTFRIDVIGRFFFGGGPYPYHVFNGYIDDLRVSKAVARYVSDFTPPIEPFPDRLPPDPNFSSVSLLLHFSGTNGSTTFIDSSSNAITVTGYNGAQISTAQSKFGGSSAYFDGSNDYLLTASSLVPLQMGTGDFTIEAFIRPTVSVNNYRGLIGLGSGDIDTLYILSGQLTWYNSGQTAGTIAVDTWHHVAASRQGTSLRVFIDGVLVNTVTNSNNISLGRAHIATRGSRDGEFFQGWMDELRITKGVARYTASFTPPIGAFPDS